MGTMLGPESVFGLGATNGLCGSGGLPLTTERKSLGRAAEVRGWSAEVRGWSAEVARV